VQQPRRAQPSLKKYNFLKKIKSLHLMAFWNWYSLTSLYLLFKPIDRNSDLKIVTFYCGIVYKHFFDRTSNANVNSCASLRSIKISVFSDVMSCILVDKYDVLEDSSACSPGPTVRSKHRYLSKILHGVIWEDIYSYRRENLKSHALWKFIYALELSYFHKSKF